MCGTWISLAHCRHDKWCPCWTCVMFGTNLNRASLLCIMHSVSVFKEHVFASGDKLYTSGRILSTEWAASNVINGISICSLVQFKIGQAASRYYCLLWTVNETGCSPHWAMVLVKNWLWSWSTPITHQNLLQVTSLLPHHEESSERITFLNHGRFRKLQ